MFNMGEKGGADFNVAKLDLLPPATPPIRKRGRNVAKIPDIFCKEYDSL